MNLYFKLIEESMRKIWMRFSDPYTSPFENTGQILLLGLSDQCPQLLMHDSSGIQTRDLWVSSRQCYHLRHGGRRPDELRQIFTFFKKNQDFLDKIPNFSNSNSNIVATNFVQRNLATPQDRRKKSLLTCLTCMKSPKT
jgi:hypothetical protein